MIPIHHQVIAAAIMGASNLGLNKPSVETVNLLKTQKNISIFNAVDRILDGRYEESTILFVCEEAESWMVDAENLKKSLLTFKYLEVFFPEYVE